MCTGARMLPRRGNGDKTMGLKPTLERIDQAQQRKPAIAIPLATVKKFGEDKSSNLAAMMAFWAFFSIFPLFIAGVTLLSWFVPESDRVGVMKGVSDYFPLIDVSTIGTLSGSVLALVVGLLAALWSGSAVVRVTQDAFNSVWEVPIVERPKLLEQLKRSILALATIGLGLLASTLVIGFVSGDSAAIDLGPLGRLVGFAAAIAVDIGLFIIAFRMLTDRQVSTRDVLPGAVFAGVAFWILQTVSSIIITRHLSSAQETYGNFATVITILWWFYLQSQLTLLGAQVNVVLKRHYWPRGLVNAPDTEADHRLLADYAKEATHVEGERVSVHVPHSDDDGDGRDDRDDERGTPVGANNGGRHARRGDGDSVPAQSPAREQSVAELLHSLSDQTTRLVKDEVRLATLELTEKGKHAGKGLGLIGAAGLIAWYGLGALVVAIILGLATAIGLWGTAAIVGGVLLAGGAGLALTGKKQLAEAVPPAPEHALDSVRTDLAVVKQRLHR
jgi:membrane protein